MLKSALEYLSCGLSIIPTLKETKDPAPVVGKWKKYQKEFPTEYHATQWFGNGNAHCIALVCGAISGNLELLDFDLGGELYGTFMQIVNTESPDLQKRLVVEKSQSGGYHLLYRCDEPVNGNAKLASRGIEVPGKGEHEVGGKMYQARKHGDKWYVVITLIETREKGGYFLCAPSPGYELKRGNIADLPVITKDERDYLLETARQLNEWVIPEVKKTKGFEKPIDSKGGKTPWADYNDKTNPVDVLKRHDWTELGQGGTTPQGGRTVFVRRPGKTKGHLGSIIEDRLFRCFTSSGAPFEMEGTYNAFEVYAMLECGGDFKRAGAKLKREGYGDQTIAPIPEPGKSKFFMCTDLGNGERFASQHRGRALYCHPWKKWFLWDEKRWLEDETSGITKLAKRTVRTIYQEAANCEDDIKREQLAKWGGKSEAKAKIFDMITLANSEEGMSVRPSELDQNPWLFNCQNGTLDLSSGEFGTANPNHKITKIANTECLLNAECPQWLDFLNTIMEGNEDTIGFLQRAVGYSLTEDDREQCLFILHGTGKNGKSTFLSTIKYILGSYAEQAEVRTFLAQKNEGIRDDLADLKGARLVVAVESARNHQFAEQLLKAMTGGDQMKARHLYASAFTFEPKFKLWIATNHKPTIKGKDEGIWRRIKLIPFNYSVPKDKLDRNLKNKLNTELPGILKWAIQGCIDWHENGLGDCDQVREAGEDYRGEMDELKDFLDTECLIDKSLRIEKGILYEAYEEWFKLSGDGEKISKTDFGLSMKERGFKEPRTKSARYWAGISTKR